MTVTEHNLNGFNFTVFANYFFSREIKPIVNTNISFQKPSNSKSIDLILIF